MDTECDVERSAGRGFNLSALYALLPLVLSGPPPHYKGYGRLRKTPIKAD